MQLGPEGNDPTQFRSATETALANTLNSKPGPVVVGRSHNCAAVIADGLLAVVVNTGRIQEIAIQTLRDNND